jgi:GNAT superfamily N-acetyltransferase
MPQVDLSSLQMRTLSLTQFYTLVEWATAEGWNPGIYDADVFYQTDPEGHVGYFLDDELIAGGSIVSYGGKFGFMGLFIVRSDYRNSGIGRQLWYQRRDRLISRLQPGAAIGMDGVVAMQPFYARGGFKLAFRDERYEFTGQALTKSPSIKALALTDVSGVLTYDAACFGVDRSGFMIAWLDLPGNSMYTYQEANQLRGFIVMRKTQIGYKIGPLFADHYEAAKALFAACLTDALNQKVFLDVSANHKDALDLVKEFGGKYVFECARMYYGNPPLADNDKVVGITSFELG